MELHGTREINGLNDGLEKPIASDHGACASRRILSVRQGFGDSSPPSRVRHGSGRYLETLSIV
jgi:hypothetical protein